LHIWFVRNLVIVSILSVLIISNIQTSIPPVYAEKEIEPIIKFDKSGYGPLDLVYIEIIYSPANTDPEVQDKLEARIFTSSGKSQPLVLYETKPGFIFGFYQYQYHTNTGIFYSYIQLRLEPPQWEGVLQVQKDDDLIAEFKTKDNMTFTKKADINFNLGQVRFNKDFFIFTERMEIIVWDIDRNSKPNTIEALPVLVWSTTERYELQGDGIWVTLRETNANSGEFRAFVTLTRNEPSSGTRLRVSDGDTVTARYMDNTLLPTGELSPKGFETFMVREVFASALIGGPCGLCPPLERAFMEEPQIFNLAHKVPISVTQLNTGDTAIIRTEITNPLNMNNQFAYIMQVKNSDDVVVSLSWIRSELRANETMKAESTWIPESPGTYVIELFIWTDIDNPVALSPVRTTEVEVK